jgi:enamidase
VPLAIRGGTLYDGTDAAPRKGSVIVIEDGVITCVGPSCRIPAAAEILDGTGHAVLPGLTDLHIHFGAPVGDDLKINPGWMIWAYLRHRPAIRQGLLESGVTTIRSVGDDANNLPRTMTWLEDGTIAGPQIIAAGPIFTAPGGHPAGTIYKDSPFLIEPGTRQMDNAETARAEVNAVLDGAFTGIKLVYDGGGKIPKLDTAVMQAIVAEARDRNAWVAAHTGSNSDIVDVVTAGVTTVEHGSMSEPLNPETIALMADKGVVFVPTLSVIEAALPSALDLAKTNAKAAFDGGVTIGVGSDTQGENMAFGTSTLREIELLMEAGIPGLSVLAGATGVAASALHSAEAFGTIQVGRRGDVTIVGADPWTDASALSEVKLVVQNGRVVYDSSKNATGSD